MSSRSQTSAVASNNELFLTSSFRVTETSKKPTKRSKYNPKRRQEVKAMRARGACLRCRLLQVSCSHHDCCTKCQILTIANHNQERKALWFSGCIRTRLLDASIFDLGNLSVDIRQELCAKEKNVAFAAITLDFASKVTWSLNSLTDDVVQWLKDPSASQTSKVGILSSPTFRDIVNSYELGDAGFGAAFQKVMYTETLIYTNGHEGNSPSLTTEDLKMIGALSGQEWLGLLEKQLKPHILASRTKEQLQLLFLLVFGTILAVGYTGPLQFEKLKYDVKSLGKQYFTETQEYLCKILAHYMVFLGTKLRLSIAEATEKHIMVAAHTRWEKEGTFLWWNTINGELEEEGEADRLLYEFDLPSDPMSDAFPAAHQAQVSGENFNCIASECMPAVDGDDVRFSDTDYWTVLDADSLFQADSGDSCQILATDSPDLTTIWQQWNPSSFPPSLSISTAAQQQLVEDTTWSNSFLQLPPSAPLLTDEVFPETHPSDQESVFRHDLKSSCRNIEYGMEKIERMPRPDYKLSDHEYILLRYASRCGHPYDKLIGPIKKLRRHASKQPPDYRAIIDEQQCLGAKPVELSTNEHNLDDINPPLTYSDCFHEAALDPWIGGTNDTEPQYLDEASKSSRLLV